MNKEIRHNTFVLLGFLFLIIFAEQAKAQEQIYLFPDRNTAVSGDTIWFNVAIFNEDTEQISNVVHVQLDNLENNHISNVSIYCSEGKGAGYIPVPDSLSTGIYVLRAFSFIQKSVANTQVNQRFISVYNRFEKELLHINTPIITNEQKYDYSNSVTIKTAKDAYKTRENVDVEINFSQDALENTSQVIITAGLQDASAKDFETSWYPSPHKTAIKLPVSIVEKNGVLISGKVHSEEDNLPVPNAVVILSIPDSIPFFDYCVSDSSGIFYFYLRNAVGTADLVLQALAKNSMQCTIELFENYIDVDLIQSKEEMYNHEELVFAEKALKASYFTKLFEGYKINSEDLFTMQRQFKHPFYGEPTKTFYPGLFIDLPNFQEVSREILRGVQYRERKNETTIRLLDLGGDAVFTEEPLKLLDGIPVFDPVVFAPMGTDDIDRVDVVNNKRFYGDLSFSGVLSIYTKNRSLTWVDTNPSTGHFEYSCIQPAQKWGFSNRITENTHVPNFDKVLYRNFFNALEAPEEFHFTTSDLKGNAVIRVILVMKDSRILYSQKVIKVE